MPRGTPCSGPEVGVCTVCLNCSEVEGHMVRDGEEEIGQGALEGLWLSLK